MINQKKKKKGGGGAVTFALRKFFSFEFDFFDVLEISFQIFFPPPYSKNLFLVVRSHPCTRCQQVYLD